VERKKAQIAVIGAGPGGYVAAIRAARLGLKTILVELGEERLGGVCLNWGCVPTKSLLHTVRTAENLMKQKDRGITLEGKVGIDLAAAVARSKKVIETLRKGTAFLLKKNKIETVYGRGRLAAPGRVEVEGKCVIECESVILAAGGRPRQLPFAPFDGEHILSTTDALDLTAPPLEAAIIGAGASGMEIGFVWAACGSKVTVIEILDRILPFLDEEAVKVIAKSCRRRGITILAGTRVTSLEKSGGKVRLKWQGQSGEGELSADKVLVTAGTSANLEGLWEPGLPIEVEGGFVRTDEAMRTTVESVYAVGDIAGPPLLAHAASREGIIAVDRIAGLEAGHSRAAAIPSVVYFIPQVAQVGIMEKEALEKNMDAAVGRFPFAATSMAVAQDETEGFVKIISEKGGGKILGATIVGSEAGELIGEISAAVAGGMTVRDFLGAVHPHPTLSEALHEAALDTLGMAIHKV
jgi:dihydrolipoamide dehydrogenase